MHILHVTDTLAVGGKERMIVDLADQAEDFGFLASVCVTRDNTTLANELNSNVKRWTLNRKRRFDFSGVDRFTRCLNAESVDILHAHGRSTFSFLALLKELGKIKQPILLHDHYGAIEIDPKIPFWFKCWGRKFVNQYVGVYDKLSSWASMAGIDSGRIKIIHNALDLSRLSENTSKVFKQELGIPDDSVVGIGVGDMRYEKGWDLFLQAAAQSDYFKNVFLIFSGGTSESRFEQKCRQIVEKTVLKGKVKFLGPRTDVPSLLKIAEFAFMPSRSESGPLVMIEYMISGLPILYTRVGDIGNRAAEYGLPGCIQSFELKRMMEELDSILMLSDEQRKVRGKKGIEIAENYFSIKKVMPIWVELYKKMLAVK